MDTKSIIYNWLNAQQVHNIVQKILNIIIEKDTIELNLFDHNEHNARGIILEGSSLEFIKEAIALVREWYGDMYVHVHVYCGVPRDLTGLLGVDIECENGDDVKMDYALWYTEHSHPVGIISLCPIDKKHPLYEELSNKDGNAFYISDWNTSVIIDAELMDTNYEIYCDYVIDAYGKADIRIINYTGEYILSFKK